LGLVIVSLICQLSSKMNRSSKVLLILGQALFELVNSFLVHLLLLVLTTKLEVCHVIWLWNFQCILELFDGEVSFFLLFIYST
jgi:hypothetical protein